MQYMIFQYWQIILLKHYKVNDETGGLLMCFDGDVVLGISDQSYIDVDFGKDILPTKIINKGDVIALGRKAVRYRWIHKEEFSGEKEYLEKLDNLLNRLCERIEYTNQLVKRYEDVNITIDIRSDYGQIGYSLPNYIIRKLGLLDCDICFDILSGGEVE